MEKPQEHDPAARIRRLTNALGSGPHSREINLHYHLRTVLKAIGDVAALRMLGEGRRAA